MSKTLQEILDDENLLMVPIPLIKGQLSLGDFMHGGLRPHSCPLSHIRILSSPMFGFHILILVKDSITILSSKNSMVLVCNSEVKDHFGRSRGLFEMLFLALDAWNIPLGIISYFSPLIKLRSSWPISHALKLIIPTLRSNIPLGGHVFSLQALFLGLD